MNGTSNNSLFFNNISILIVEDDVDTAELFTLFLTSLGAEVVASGTMAEALAVLENFHPDIIISDWQLPDGNGCLLMNQLRNSGVDKLKEVSAIAITGYSTELLEQIHSQEILSSGFQRYLSKPLDIDELLTAIAKLTGLPDNQVHLYP